MFKMMGVFLFLLAIDGCLFAQTPQPPAEGRRTQGYVFVGPGGYTDSSVTQIQLGAGAEHLIYDGVAVGGEVAYFSPARSFGSGVGAFSPNLSYHFLKTTKSRKFVPFVTGGYTLLFRSGTANGVNFGGGFNYWFKEKVGLRIEARDQILLSSDSFHFLGVRFGVSFR